jgi:hypothetical protein
MLMSLDLLAEFIVGILLSVAVGFAGKQFAFQFVVGLRVVGVVRGG